MATNPILDNFGDKTEQNILDDILIESIQFAGMDLYYLPRTRNNFDKVQYEDTQSSFEQAYLFEWYLDRDDSFEMPDFGAQGYFMNDSLKFQCSITRFRDEVYTKDATITRPKEGDLLFFPMNGRVFEITFVENKPYFYQLGELQLFEVDVRAFNMTNEVFNTGITEIDAIRPEVTSDTQDFVVKSDEGEIITGDDGAMVISDEFDQVQANSHPEQTTNKEFQSRINQQGVIDWSEKNPFADYQKY